MRAIVAALAIDRNVFETRDVYVPLGVIEGKLDGFEDVIRNLQKRIDAGMQFGASTVSPASR